MAGLSIQMAMMPESEDDKSVIQINKSDMPRGHKFKFSPEEDETLKKLVQTHGTNKWSLISKLLKCRTARQCRDRWNHYLSNNSEQIPWTENEDAKLLRLHNEIGPKWTIIATYFEGRNSVTIRNRCCRLIRRMNSKKNKKHIEASNSSSDESPMPPTMNARIILPSCSLLPFPWM
ncbi:Myb-like DNA-binding domain containing protein [Trichomonas vaginalis G3]|uniref:Myb-like DNA-binding domain containing protein n=1 Tax=Trichomonas vaginalis (strain ATCC PRA-98 / G3) TaxID=412133 RepID=A2FK50_TRIV3|nr:RNA polymerase II transcription regulator recruiting protein [Trichomonas vaginalis G3]EAX94729.1 Myb-like DNA-binding domain containing protein [Trichomonas vaginalis G3]KAI5539634.1 RNA polymerase II transcription regulator recruiting protein [Trichomonas vaginalis G3]|eukprot:XP_001307659.1 Myb-like DNA-binding domain containing protein [Trichomonas vaginalis G3]